MKIRQLKNGDYKIHIDDMDSYEVTDDNGVDFWPTDAQMQKIWERWGETRRRRMYD